MKQLLCILVALAIAGPVVAQSSAAVPDYLGFYGLNIPGFSWEPGSGVTAQYSRLTGTLNLDQTSHPAFVSTEGQRIPLTLDQTSRLLLAVPGGASFDLAGLAGRATRADGTTQSFFVVFVALVGEKEISLAPSLRSAAAEKNPGGNRNSNGPGSGGSGPPGGGPF